VREWSWAQSGGGSRREGIAYDLNLFFISLFHGSCSATCSSFVAMARYQS
jgi:hypothetical protein